jgi:O-antigen/teichoic acid export membrane protein
LSTQPAELKSGTAWNSSAAAPLRQTRKAWARQGALAILDQGLMSGSNFVLSILLARWLSPYQYGAYAVAFAVFLFVAQLHQAAILEPMSVFGGGVMRSRLKAYLGDLLWIHFAIGGVIAIILAGLAFVPYLFHGQDMRTTLIVMAPVVPCILLLWLTRRACYLEHAPGLATTGSLLYSLVLLLGVFLAYEFGVLSSPVAFILMGTGALITSIVQLLRLRPQVDRRSHPFLPGGVWSRHFKYGRWAQVSAIFIWITSSFYYLLLGKAGGLQDAAELRALFNFSLPVVQSVTAIALLVQPRISRAAHEQGPSAVLRWSVRMMKLYALGAFVYWLPIYLLSAPLVHKLYRGNYSEITSLIPVVAFASIISSASSGIANGLRAVELPSAVAYMFGLSSLVTILVGTPMTLRFGLEGAIWTWAAANAIGLGFGSVMMRRRLRS